MQLCNSMLLLKIYIIFNMTILNAHVITHAWAHDHVYLNWSLNSQSIWPIAFCNLV